MESCIMFIDWNAVKMLIHFTLANGFKAIPIKIATNYFMDIDKLFIWFGKRPRVANTTLKKNKIEELTLLDFKAYYKITAIKIVWYCQKNKQLDQWGRMKSMEIDSHK